MTMMEATTSYNQILLAVASKLAEDFPNYEVSHFSEPFDYDQAGTEIPVSLTIALLTADPVDEKMAPGSGILEQFVTFTIFATLETVATRDDYITLINAVSNISFWLYDNAFSIPGIYPLKNVSVEIVPPNTADELNKVQYAINFTLHALIGEDDNFGIDPKRSLYMGPYPTFPIEAVHGYAGQEEPEDENYKQIYPR